MAARATLATNRRIYVLLKLVTRAKVPFGGVVTFSVILVELCSCNPARFLFYPIAKSFTFSLLANKWFPIDCNRVSQQLSSSGVALSLALLSSSAFSIAGPRTHIESALHFVYRLAMAASEGVLGIAAFAAASRYPS
jgi:hypothetical protein